MPSHQACQAWAHPSQETSMHAGSARPRARRIAVGFPNIRASATLVGVAAVSTLLAATAAHARITRIQSTSTQSPAFGGYAWPEVGQYEKIAGVAFGEVDPKDPKNAVITDIALAPKNARGKVEYSF